MSDGLNDRLKNMGGFKINPDNIVKATISPINQVDRHMQEGQEMMRRIREGKISEQVRKEIEEE